MKVYEILAFNKELLEKLYSAGLNTSDFLYVGLYNEYDRLNAYGTLRRESNMLFYDYKKDDIKMILSNIKKACEAITYDRTILYRQCQEYLLRYRGE